MNSAFLADHLMADSVFHVPPCHSDQSSAIYHPPPSLLANGHLSRMPQVWFRGCMWILDMIAGLIVQYGKMENVN